MRRETSDIRLEYFIFNEIAVFFRGLFKKNPRASTAASSLRPSTSAFASLSLRPGLALQLALSMTLSDV
jgi:hypothetical protein